LLAVLAVAGDAGLSREKLVGLLWADADGERARHSLTQALYAARRALRCDDLFVATAASVRLDFERLACDVRDFEQAIESGDLERAVAAYGGPFLDGFFLSGAPEFDQWSSAQRERLQSTAARALETLAARSEEAGDLADAVAWRRRLTALAPLDSANVAKLMNALARSGDRAGALQQARLHATLLHQELELEPDPAVESLATQLRVGTSWEPGSAAEIAVPGRAERSPSLSDPAEAEASPDSEDRTPAEPYRADDAPVVAPVVSPSDPVPALLTDRDVVEHVEHAASEWPRRTIAQPMAQVSLPIWLRWTILSIVIFTLLGVGVLIGRSRRDTGPAVERLPVPQRVVVAPFRVMGADPSLAYLRDGMVELLSTRLADDTAARSVDAGAVLGAWRAAGLTQAMDVPRDTVVKLASRLGAKRVVVGSVVGTPGRVMLRAALLVVPSGEVSAEASITGAVDGLTGLIDRLAGQLLASEAGEDERLALQTTRSLPALRAFLAGQASLRALDYTAAMRQYDLALRRDTSFALAALQAATLADRLFDVAQLRRNLRTAWAHRDALSARDRLLLGMYVGPGYPAPATVGEQRAAWQRILDAPTTDADLWFTLGARILHDGELAALPSSRARSTEALQRALTVAPHAPARGLLAAMGELAIDAGTDAAALGPFAPFARWRRAVAHADDATLHQLRDTMFRLGPANLRAIAMSSQYDGIALDDGAEAIEQLGARALRSSERIDVLLAEHAQAMLRGRVAEALAVIDRLERVQPTSSAADRLRVLDGVYGGGDSTAAAGAARALANLTGPDPSAGMTSSGAWAANVCVLGQRSVARGDTMGIRRAMERLRAHPVEDVPNLPVSAAPGACADLLGAAHAVIAGARDARTRLRQLDSLVLTPHVVGDLAQYAPLLIARLHERLDDHAGALAAMRRRPYMADWPRYLGAMLREEARLAQQMGDAAGADAARVRVNAYGDSAVASAPATRP